jgi:hypothetical protein
MSNENDEFILSEGNLLWERDVAEQIHTRAQQICKDLSEITHAVQGSSLAEEQKKLARRFLGRVLASVVGELIMPIERLYPDLHCD